MRRADPRLAKIKIKQLHRLLEAAPNRELVDECVYLLGAVDLEQESLIRTSVERLRTRIDTLGGDLAQPVGVLFAEICEALGIRFST